VAFVPAHTREFLAVAAETARGLDVDRIDELVNSLADVRQREGRLFVLGVGGSAANASHAVNDFRKLCGIEAYCPTDNVAELTARTNDEGWETTLDEWLRTSRICDRDAVLVLSVGGGDVEQAVSVNLVRAIDFAQAQSAGVFGIVGRDGGYTARTADVAVIIPTVAANLVTPVSESFQSVVLHCIVSHPALALGAAKWESLASAGPASL
jgi:D-sedoheptulose 7-phosphate isomerase